MAKVIFENLTKQQAKVFAEWYCGQGEQDADVWFDVNCEDGTPMTDCGRKGGYKEIIKTKDPLLKTYLNNGDVIVYCK